MACSYDGDNFCYNKLLLDPKEASFFDLIYLLFSSDIKSRRFVECPEEQELIDFSNRWLIFISVLAQKIFVYIRDPLAEIGHAIETWLNLVSNNGGVFLLFFKFLKGNEVRTDRSSPSFRSLIGNLDQRVEMDKSIQPGNRKYNSALALMAAKLSYENQAFVRSIVTDHWNMEFLGFYNFWNEHQKLPSTQAFMLHDKKTDPNLIVVAFRGTDPFDANAWLIDVDLSWYELQGIGKIHRGFMQALGLQKDGWPNEIAPSSDDHLYAYYELRRVLKDILNKNGNAKFIVTGHSLGGALAILFVGVLAMHKEAWLLDRMEGVYTFGQPRVGDRQFGRFMEDKLKEYDVRYLRYVYCNDLVPRLPYDDSALLYKHFGPCLYYNSFYHGKVLREEPNKNYFNLLWVIPKNLNACWELIRSFIIPFVGGREYREGWFMKVFRLVGLLIPGLSAHSPQDYNNATRLGSLPQQDLHQD
ncbi:uncharacterized LOC8278856 [Ricinus communis]|uniref:Triacylglycerol acidic lipase TAL5 n=1 Tax=Ricinus communis TaxID=3988 RepID=B9R7B0_RICCO|nr:uncharacterized LOC8278856 [Ricinus communis]AFQ93687.1 triacylglycerol acidic lipase TAL5 [Ricinus communis]EEF52390.1 triacylglycerol lipase, putative [Ricinus communis]|eukprot:NP_001310678.1 uncharacterized LOC8278856 [Ricinus communis]